MIAMRKPGVTHKRSAIKAIIFDCFGVLAEDGWIPLKRKYVGDNQELAREIADLGKQNEYGFIDNESHLTKMANLMKLDIQILREALGRRVPNEELFSYINKNLKNKYKIGLMSNANYDVVGSLFTMQQAKGFDAYVLSYESRLIKPDRKMYELMASRLGVEMSECIFVDDQERYCTAAEEYGMTALLYRDYDSFMVDIEALLTTK